MRKLVIMLFCFGSITGMTINPGFCQSIEDILKSSSIEDSETEDSQSKDQQEPSEEEGKDQQPDQPAHVSPENQFAIQFGTFKSQGAADEQVIELKTKGYDPYIFQGVNAQGQTIHAVRIGEFSSYQNAAEKLDELKDSVDTPGLIARYDSLEIAESKERAEEAAQMAQKSETQKILEAERKKGRTDGSAGGEEGLLERIDRLESELNQLKEAEKVRDDLQMTEEEAKEEQEDILEAAGREYTLTGEGNIRFSYGFGYTYSEYNAIKESVRVEDVANHTIRNSFNVSYGLKDNFTLGTGIPFVYRYHRVGTVDSEEVTDLGDLSINWRYQPVKSSRDLPTIIVNGGFNVPVGRSPYEIDPGVELSTSSGMYSSNLGVSVSQVTDPVVVFSSLSATYRFPVEDINQKRNEGILDEVDPGMGFGIGAGMGYALSYKLNLNMSINYSYSFETEYKYKNAAVAESGTSASASMSLGVGYRLSRTQNLNFSFGIPITNTGSFSFSLSTPIEFEL
ncbi:MAG: SPOR domain-containing protein [Desulfobacterales bacterium]|nr:SPOR domain-containing protein [Desulfobacterales bacterium]